MPQAQSPVRPAAVPGTPALHPGWHYHFLGIGGVGMSALAEVLHARGIRVSGSDIQGGSALEHLAALGIPTTVGHRADALADADAVVFTPAVPVQHPIWQAVRERGLPCLHRAQLLGAVAAEQRTLAVTGTHGKTTCTGALAQALSAAGWHPTALVGGHLPQWEGRNTLVGDGPWLVCEADESDGSFVHLAPEGVLLTNVEEDHLDFHGTLANLHAAFGALLARIRPGGRLVYCAEDAAAAELAARYAGARIAYGCGADADARVEVLAEDAQGMRLRLYRRHAGGEETHTLHTPLRGRHNALNLCGVFALARAMEAPAEPVLAGLADFRGVARRRQLLGRVAGLTLFDDYAHHPTEIRATLETFRADESGALTVVFQPHLYSRTARFARDFADALRRADRVYVTDVYAAREAPLEGVSGRLIVDALAGHPAAAFLPHWRDLLPLVRGGAVPPGVLLSLGAGDVTGLGPLLLRELA